MGWLVPIIFRQLLKVISELAVCDPPTNFQTRTTETDNISQVVSVNRVTYTHVRTHARTHTIVYIQIRYINVKT